MEHVTSNMAIEHPWGCVQPSPMIRIWVFWDTSITCFDVETTSKHTGYSVFLSLMKMLSNGE